MSHGCQLECLAPIRWDEGMVFSYEELRMKDYIGWGVAQFWKNIMNMFDLHPRKLRMEKQRRMKMYLLLKMVFFKSRVSFQGCMYIVYVSYLIYDRCDYPYV